MASLYRQLVLFDCDGGRASLFDDRTILDQLPSNCEFYLFWNKDNKSTSDKLSRLQSVSGIHPYPSKLKDSKNSADGKLIYFLGKFVDRYSFILIIHGNDIIYREIIESVIHDYAQEKISDKPIRYPSSQELRKLFAELQERNKKHEYLDQKSPTKLLENPCMHELIDISDISCLKCPKKCKTTISLYQHVKDKHIRNGLLTCVCSFKSNNFNALHHHQTKECEQFKKEQRETARLAENELVKVYFNPKYTLLVVWTTRKNKYKHDEYHHRYFSPLELFLHLHTKHHDDTDTRIQCCDPTSRYTLNDFGQHVDSDHSIVNVQ